MVFVYRTMAACKPESSSQEPFDVHAIIKEPLDPASHGHGAGMILTVKVVRCNNPFDDATDHFSIVMLLRDQTIREFHVKPVAVCTEHTANKQVFNMSTFLSADPLSGIPVTHGLTAAWAQRVV